MRMPARPTAHEVLTVVTLGLAVGLHPAIYAIVHQVVLHPLQVPDAGRVAILYEQRPGGPNDSLMERAARPLLSSPPAAFSAVGAELTRPAILQDFPGARRAAPGAGRRSGRLVARQGGPMAYRQVGH
jgi:hypothetical protein